MNRRWKSIFMVLLVTLMLVAVTGTAMAYKKNHYTKNLQYTCQWGASEVYSLGPQQCIGNFSMYQ